MLYNTFTLVMYILQPFFIIKTSSQLLMSDESSIGVGDHLYKRACYNWRSRQDRGRTEVTQLNKGSYGASVKFIEVHGHETG